MYGIYKRGAVLSSLTLDLQAKGEKKTNDQGVINGSYPWGGLLARESGLKMSLLNPVTAASILGYLGKVI
jgi:hypothetical protein